MGQAMTQSLFPQICSTLHCREEECSHSWGPWHCHSAPSVLSIQLLKTLHCTYVPISLPSPISITSLRTKMVHINLQWVNAECLLQVLPRDMGLCSQPWRLSFPKHWEKILIVLGLEMHPLALQNSAAWLKGFDSDRPDNCTYVSLVTI